MTPTGRRSSFPLALIAQARAEERARVAAVIAEVREKGHREGTSYYGGWVWRAACDVIAARLGL